MQNRFASSIKLNQQNDFHEIMYTRKWKNHFAGSSRSDQQNDFSRITYTRKWKNRFAGPTGLNQQNDFHRIVYIYAGKERKSFCWFDSNGPAKWFFSNHVYAKVKKSFCWSNSIQPAKWFFHFSFFTDCKLVITNSDITFFAWTRATQQWSCRTMLMLWWSVCSASVAVLMQLH